MPQTLSWMENDQTPDNPYGKSEDYEAFLDYLGALRRPLTPEQAGNPIVINVSELNDHPEFKAAAIGALQQWSATTPMEFVIVDDRPYNPATDYMQVVSPELGEEDDGSAYSAGRYVSIGQRFHDTEPSRTDLGGYVFDSFIHEFGHEFGLNHPGLYNYSGPEGDQITYINNATWVYDRQQYSVMSYFDGIDVGEPTRWSPTTPLIADIEAVIRRFYSTVDANGVRTYQDIQLNTGNDVYGFGSTKFGFELTATGMTHNTGFVIHDTGGIDTVSFAGSTSGTIMDLRPGQFSSVNGHNNNVAIFDGHNANGSQYIIERGIGSRFNDTMIANQGNNVMAAGAGNDRIAGFEGNDILDGGDGADIIFGGLGNDIITGGRDSLASRDINNTIDVEDLADQTESYDGNDFLYGEEGNDVINGGQGDDLLNGGDGNDVLRGQDGEDIFIGGAGVDTVDFSRESPFQLLVNLQLNIAEGGTGSGDRFYSIENLIGSDDRIDRFIGTAAANHFIGQGGGDYFNGAGGNDVLDGGRDGDILSGDAGNDTIIGGAGRDGIHGGAGIDTAVYTGSTQAVIIDLAAGTGRGGHAQGEVQIVGRGPVIRGEVLSGIENVIGSSFGDRLLGGAGVNLLAGAAGDDTLAGGLGVDVLNGGLGNDTADYFNSTAAVNINMLAGRNGGDVYVSIESVSGTAFNDVLTGNAGANTLTGQGGNDVIHGAAGNDIVYGDFALAAPTPTEPGIGTGTGYTTLAPTATNNSIATAFDITSNFAMTADPDIWDATTIPHSTINATGNGQAGYYKVTLNAGSLLSIDIDHIGDPNYFDSFVRLVRSDGTIVASNDDASGDPGSVEGTDSQFSFAVEQTGSYYIVVGSWTAESPDPSGYTPIVDDGAPYELNVSVDFQQTGAPTPGTAGNDVLDGGLGNDTLTGGAGSDSFRFSSALNATTNVDRIADFNVVADTISLAASVFAAAGAAGALAADAFWSSVAGTAHDATDRIIYDLDGGTLSYDADGNGAGLGVLFARLVPNLGLTASDFVVA